MEKVYVQSSDIKRTSQSAYAQLVGTFGLNGNSSEEFEWNEVKDLINNMADKYTVNQIASEDDFLLHLREENCPRFKDIIESGYNNPKIFEMTDVMDRFFSQLFYERLTELTGIVVKKNEHSKAREICVTIFWMQQSEIPLNFEMTDEDEHTCAAIYQLG